MPNRDIRRQRSSHHPDTGGGATDSAAPGRRYSPTNELYLVPLSKDGECAYVSGEGGRQLRATNSNGSRPECMMIDKGLHNFCSKILRRMQGEGSQNGNPKIEWDTCLEEVADQCRVNVGDGVRIRDQP